MYKYYKLYNTHGKMLFSWFKAWTYNQQIHFQKYFRATPTVYIYDILVSRN